MRLRGRRSVTQNASVWSEIMRRPVSVQNSLKGASGSAVLANDGKLIGIHIASVPRRGRTMSLHPELLSEFLGDQDISPGESFAEIVPMNKTAPTWLINGAELKAFGTIARAYCWY